MKAGPWLTCEHFFCQTFNLSPINAAGALDKVIPTLIVQTTTACGRNLRAIVKQNAHHWILRSVFYARML